MINKNLSTNIAQISHKKNVLVDKEGGGGGGASDL